MGDSIWLTNAWQTAVYILAAFALIFIARLFFMFFKKGLDFKHELLEEDNFAFSISVVGYFVAVLISVGSAIVGPTHGFGLDLMFLMVYGLFSIILLTLSAGINDKFILRRFSVRKEIHKDHNAGTGVIVGANYIASALIIFGAMTGAGKDFFPDVTLGFLYSGMITAGVFWLAGQLLMVIFTWVYDLVTPYNLHDEVEKDNVAVSLAYAGMIIGVGLLIFNGVSGDFYSWSDHFMWLGIEVAIGLVLLPIIRMIVDKILLPGKNITDELVNQDKPNLGVGLIEGFAYFGGALLIILSI